MPVKTMAERKALDPAIEYALPTMELSQSDIATIRFFLGMAWEHMPEHYHAAYGQELEALYRQLNRGRPITELYKRS